MKTLTKRILLTVIGIPVFFSSIYFFPQGNYAIFTIIIMGFSILGSFEMYKMLHHSDNQRSLVHPVFAGLLPITAYIQLYMLPGYHFINIVYIAVILGLLFYETIHGKIDNFQGSTTRMAYSITHLVYPSGLLLYVFYMTALDHAPLFIIFWFLMIFSNDVFAYVFGISFGKNSRGIMPVSPNKSLVGFIGGFSVTILNGIIYYTVVTPLHEYGSLLLYVLLSAGISLFANAGDLVESALKRSSQKKDSGIIVPGRGGILDTIDSIVFSAPFFYYFVLYILKV